MTAKVKVNVRMPDITIKNPTKRFWGRLGNDAATDIVKRTLDGVDVNRRMFPRYSPGYAKKRAKLGRSTRPNLALSTRMLNFVGRGVRFTTYGFKIILSGTQGFKAWANEQTGRDFFGLNKAQKDKILKQVTLFYTKVNKLKKR
jgi:hypothetical protein